MNTMVNTNTAKSFLNNNANVNYFESNNNTMYNNKSNLNNIDTIEAIKSKYSNRSNSCGMQNLLPYNSNNIINKYPSSTNMVHNTPGNITNNLKDILSSNTNYEIELIKSKYSNKSSNTSTNTLNYQQATNMINTNIDYKDKGRSNNLETLLNNSILDDKLNKYKKENITITLLPTTSIPKPQPQEFVLNRSEENGQSLSSHSSKNTESNVLLDKIQYLEDKLNRMQNQVDGNNIQDKKNEIMNRVRNNVGKDIESKVKLEDKNQDEDDILLNEITPILKNIERLKTMKFENNVKIENFCNSPKKYIEIYNLGII